MSCFLLVCVFFNDYDNIVVVGMITILIYQWWQNEICIIYILWSTKPRGQIPIEIGNCQTSTNPYRHSKYAGHWKEQYNYNSFWLRQKRWQNDLNRY